MVVYKEASETGVVGGGEGKASVVWVSSPGQMGTGYPAQYASVIIFQRLIRGAGGAQEVQTLPQAVTPAFWWCPSLSLAMGLYYELSTPALWWDTEAGLGHRGQDQDNGHGLDQGRGCPPSLLGVCCLPAIGLCRDAHEHIRTPQRAHL